MRRCPEAVKDLLRRRIGRRGAALLFFALLDFVYCYSLLSPPQDASANATFRFVVAVAPLWVWAILWGSAGVACLVNAFRRSDKVGFAAAIGIKVLWGCLYVLAIFNHVPRAYVPATIWLCLAGWVAIISSWPEPPDVSSWPEPPGGVSVAPETDPLRSTKQTG